MTEPTTWNEFSVAHYNGAPLAEGQLISIQMTAYAVHTAPGAAPTIQLGGGPARMVDLSRYAPTPEAAAKFGIPYHVSATNYIVGDTTPGATGDVFAVRLVDSAETLPSPNAQLILLQTADGQYVTSDSSGYYHANATEAEAAVFMFSHTGSPPRVTLSPTLELFGSTAPAAGEPSGRPPLGTFSVQFVQPIVGGGMTAGGAQIPIVPNGPILLQQVEGTPVSSELVIDVMDQQSGTAMYFQNGNRIYDSHGALYLVLDGQLRFILGGAANPMFVPLSTLSTSVLPASAESTTPFGSPLSDDACIGNVPGQAEFWLLNDGVKRWIESPAVMTLYGFNPATLKSFTADQIAGIPTGPSIGMDLDAEPFTDGTRARDASTGNIYLAIDGELRWIPNPTVYNNLFDTWSGIVSRPTLSPTVFRIGPQLDDNCHLIAAPGCGVAMVVDGVRRHIANPATMTRFSFSWTTPVTLTPAAFNAYPQGVDIEY